MLAVIAINLSISPDHFIASFNVAKVSSVVNDFDETIKRVFSGFKFLVFSWNSLESDPVIKTWLNFPSFTKETKHYLINRILKENVLGKNIIF